MTWDERQADLAMAIVDDYQTLFGAVERLNVRMYQYKGFAKNNQALCDAEDAIYAIQQQTKKLKTALEAIDRPSVLKPLREKQDGITRQGKDSPAKGARKKDDPAL